METSLYLSNNTLTASLTDSDGDAVTGATGTVTILDADRAEVTGPTWPVALQDQSDGTYTYAIPYNLLERGREYIAQVSFSSPGHRYAEITIECTVDTT